MRMSTLLWCSGLMRRARLLETHPRPSQTLPDPPTPHGSLGRVVGSPRWGARAVHGAEGLIAVRSLRGQLVITLSGDEFVPELVTDTLLARQFFDGLSGSGGGTNHGFDAEVRDSAAGPLDITMLRLTSPAQLVLRVPARPLFEVASPETVSVALPGAALLSRRSISTNAALVIRADRGTVSIDIDVAYRTADGGLSIQDEVRRSGGAEERPRAELPRTDPEPAPTCPGRVVGGEVCGS